jgi:hypothetical protein
LPRALDAFFQRALSTSRDARYGSAQELAAAFNAAVGLAGTASGAVGALAAGAPELAATALAPRQAAFGSLAAPSVATSFAQPSLAATPPAAATRPASAWPWIVLACFLLASGVVGAAFVLSRSPDDRSQAANADDESSDEEDERPKKKKKTKKTDDAEAPADEPDKPSAQPPPAAPEAKTADPKETATARPTAAPATPSAPKPPPLTFLYTGTACWAYSNKTCPTVADCCPGSGPRDITQWAPPRAGKDRAECRCMRPKCGPGENWSTHKCKM